MTLLHDFPPGATVGPPAFAISAPAASAMIIYGVAPVGYRREMVFWHIAIASLHGGSGAVAKPGAIYQRDNE
jgi:hypothetical protein